MPRKDRRDKNDAEERGDRTSSVADQETEADGKQADQRQVEGAPHDCAYRIVRTKRCLLVRAACACWPKRNAASVDANDTTNTRTPKTKALATSTGCRCGTAR